MCSADMGEFIRDNHLDLSLNGELQSKRSFRKP